MTKGKNAIIVLNYNDSKTVVNYIQLIKDYKNIDKIVIVDNCSTDDSFKILKKYANNKIDVVKSPENKGYAYGNNYGVHYLENKKEKYDYITISNPDVSVEDETILKMEEFLDKHKDVAIVAPTMYYANGEASDMRAWKERKLDSDITDSSIRLTRKAKKSHIERYDDTYFNSEYSYVDCVPGSFFMIKYDVFKSVNYFDENTFLYYEEDILGKKLKNEGYKTVLLNREKFTHYESVSINKNMMSLNKYYEIQKSKRYYHEMYNEECRGEGKANLIKLDKATKIGAKEIKNQNSILTKIRNRIMYDGIILTAEKIFIYCMILLLLPIRMIIRKLRKSKKVCYFSLVTWKWIKQRPHFVALSLADTYKVEYRYLDLKDKYKNDTNNKIASSYVNNKIENKNLKIKPYYIYPGDNKYRLKRALTYLRLITFNYDVFIYTQPTQIESIFIKALELNKTKIYYECMDNYIGWESNKRYFRDMESKLIAHSKNVFVSSQKLLDNISDKYDVDKKKFILVRNGYDHNLFDHYKKSETKIVKPAITYIGTIDNWFDIENIVKYAEKHKDYNFNIVGPMNPSVKEDFDKIKLKNIIIHGPIEHDLVPSYIEESDVMIMPFIINDIIIYVDPVKVYEYLYFKKNVVSSYWSELDQFNGLIYYYKNDDEFEKAIDEALKNKFIVNDKYKQIMEESKWDNRLQIYTKTLEEKNE